MIKLIINNKEITAEEGTTVLQTARKSGFEIPTLCHHESLLPYGSCRFCIVEVKRRGKTKYQTSCTLPVAEEMEIKTHSERVMKIRRILVELMLARCPESEVIRDLARQIDVGHCRFERPKGEKSPCSLCNACTIVEETKMQTSGERPSTFVNKGSCILCGMCVRLCDDVMKVGALAFEGRGIRRHVTTPFRQPSEFCTSCGACSSICPTGAIELLRIRPQELVPIPSEFDCGLSNRKPIYLPFPQAVPRVPIIDQSTCMNFVTGGCKICEDNCDAEAIDHSQKDVVDEIDVGTIILATGFKTFDARRLGYYGYGVYPNVYTALEVERLINASGPTSGEIVLRTGQKPKSVAIIHCVGSRDKNTNRWCSRTCCMYSLKLAHLLKEHTNAEVYNFYIDMRTAGKGYEEFYDKLLEENVHFIRGRVAEVTDCAVRLDEEGKLIIRAEDTMIGIVRRVPVDMVVLAVGMEPQADSQDVRRMFNISCSTEGFFLERHPKLAPVDTFTDGIFIAGACQGPKDIPDSVAQAGAAAAQALILIDSGEIELEPNTAFVVQEECSGCRTCLTICPYNAISRDDAKQKAFINEALCKGCGTCVAACPSGAIKQNLFEDEMIFSEIDGLLKMESPACC
jgi:heterodisulfide reductase subunit A-like polyferredoxin